MSSCSDPRLASWLRRFTFPAHLKQGEEYHNGLRNFISRQINEGAPVIYCYDPEEEECLEDDPIIGFRLLPAIGGAVNRAAFMNVIMSYANKEANYVASNQLTDVIYSQDTAPAGSYRAWYCRRVLDTRRH